MGIEDIIGIDGDHVGRKSLEIPAERFLTADLGQIFRLARQFDLVLPLEVAEHIPKECAKAFVDSLTRLGPVILFPAAILFQEGNQRRKRTVGGLLGRALSGKRICGDCLT